MRRLLKFVSLIKYCLAWHCNSNFCLRLKGYPHRVVVRGRSSDLKCISSVLADQGYEIPEVMNPKVIIDLGANAGYASVFFANRFPDAKIVALEPDKANFELACLNTANYPNVEVVNAAISSNGLPVMLLNAGSTNWGYRFGAASSVSAVNPDRTIPSMTIRQLFERFNIRNVDVLKIDIEGAEKELFEGSPEWMEHIRCLCIEVHAGAWKAFFDAMSRFDYDCRLSGEVIIVSFDDKL